MDKYLENDKLPPTDQTTDTRSKEYSKLNEN